MTDPGTRTTRVCSSRTDLWTRFGASSCRTSFYQRKTKPDPKEESGISPTGTTIRKSLDPNRVWAERWLYRIQAMYSPQTEQPNPWRSEGSDVLDADLLYRMLRRLDLHFRYRGAGLMIADLAMMYLYRCRISVTKHTARRLVVVATMLAMKVEDDDAMPNSEWAKCVDLPLKELNALERMFCESSNWAFWLAPPPRHSVDV